jgi:hypothetical protein
MSNDVPNSDVADQLHYDLLVKRLTGGDNTEFSNDLEKGASVDEVSKTVSRRVFLQPRYLDRGVLSLHRNFKPPFFLARAISPDR